MIKLTYICDHCSVEVEKVLDTPVELDRANWRNGPEGWISIGVGEQVLLFCSPCNAALAAQKAAIEALQAQMLADAQAAAQPPVGE